MAAYKVLIKPSAVKELEKVTSQQRQRVIAKIKGLGNNPRPVGCEKLSGEDKYRFRQAPYRVVYGVDDRQRTVLVVKVGHRKDVYR